ncbi:DUF1365 domain-containing protein [Methylibium rhizosphaerae]|uniref:DUF1365 domain-containing protein n=1 Tax=Methylibium rhizosphaerae TaxID=2570323 RepID=UPI00112EC34C|nr:DUF1365 domain-containing protein [Methylibium rhizosphaerae]
MGAARSFIGFGTVSHTRLRPARHEFSYPTYFLMLPMRSLRKSADPALCRNRFGLVSFFDADHGDGRADALAWLDELLAREGLANATGEVWLHTYPRVLGYAFKPVSFWYCHREDESLAAIVVEVNNTFGERHCYLLSGAELAWGRELQANKTFHVSPFCRVEGSYRFRFMRTGSSAAHPLRTVVRIDHDDAHGPLLKTSVSGALQRLDAAAMRRAFFGMPLMTFGVIARIHWQALKLWLKRVPFFTKPQPPKLPVSRS